MVTFWAKLFFSFCSSDLKRANKTCQLIMEENQSSAITSEDIIKDELIKERSFGEFENKLVCEYEAVVKAENPSFKIYDYTPKTGESRETVRNRARKCLQVCFKNF